MAEHIHQWTRRQNVTSGGYVMPPYETCDCGDARTLPDYQAVPEPREDVAVAEVLAAHHLAGWTVFNTECACGGQEGVDYYTHLAEVLAPLIAERELAAAVEALREAADEIDATVGTEPVLMHVVDWVDGVEYAARRVRDRADRRAER